MVTRKGRRSRLIRKIVEIIHDAGEPLPAQEIINRALHLRICPTMNQLGMLLRRHPEFIVVKNKPVNFYWLSDIVEDVNEIWKCHICNEVVSRENNPNLNQRRKHAVLVMLREKRRRGELPKPDLIIDTNERGSLCESIERKARKEGLNVTRQTLVVGDYLLGGACVEAKSINDLFQSIHSGHLWRQLDNMDANYERFFLVIHGSVQQYVAMAKTNGKQKVTYSSVQNKLTGIIARVMSDFECQVFYAPNISEVAMFVTKLHGKLHKPASRHGAQAVRRVSTNDVRKDILLTIPGLGPELVDRLLDKCGSIEEMAYPDVLKQVKGLGDKKRSLIVEVLTSEEPVHIERTVRR